MSFKGEYETTTNSCVDARKWFTGPKITLDVDTLTEEQLQAVKEDGIKVEGTRPSDEEASITAIEKE